MEGNRKKYTGAKILKHYVILKPKHRKHYAKFHPWLDPHAMHEYTEFKRVQGTVYIEICGHWVLKEDFTNSTIQLS